MNPSMLNLVEKSLNLEEINQVPENRKLPKLNQNELDHLNCPIVMKENS